MTAKTETFPSQNQPSLGALLVSLIDKPGDTFRVLAARRGIWRWLLPVLISFLALAVLALVQTPYTMEIARQQAEQQLAAMPPEQAEAARQSMAFGFSFPFMLGTTLVSGLLALIVILLIQAAFFYFGGLLLGGSEMTFGAIFTMTVWARLPLALGALVLAGFIAVSGRFIQYPGLAFLATSGDVMQDAANPMIALLSGVDLFWAWNLILLIIGLTVVARLSRIKAILLVVIFAALSLGVILLPSLIFRTAFGG